MLEQEGLKCKGFRLWTKDGDFCGSFAEHGLFPACSVCYMSTGRVAGGYFTAFFFANRIFWVIVILNKFYMRPLGTSFSTSFSNLIQRLPSYSAAAEPSLWAARIWASGLSLTLHLHILTMPLPYSLTVRPGHVSLMCHSCVLHCVDISAGEHFLQVLGFFEVFTCLFKCQCSNWLTKSSQSLQLYLLYLPAQYFSTPLVLTQWIVILVLAELTCEHLDKISVVFFFFPSCCFFLCVPDMEAAL